MSIAWQQAVDEAYRVLDVVDKIQVRFGYSGRNLQFF